jgi:hypothetical protein
MVTRFKWEVLDCIGYVFCEFSFRWFDRFDVPFDEADWRWYHRVNYFIGSASYGTGCFFYGLQDDV